MPMKPVPAARSVRAVWFRVFVAAIVLSLHLSFVSDGAAICAVGMKMDLMLRLHNDQSLNAAMQQMQDLGKICVQHDGFVTKKLTISMLAPDKS